MNSGLEPALEPASSLAATDDLLLAGYIGDLA
jgi:hypothetical protein